MDISNRYKQNARMLSASSCDLSDNMTALSEALCQLNTESNMEYKNEIAWKFCKVD